MTSECQLEYLKKLYPQMQFELRDFGGQQAVYLQGTFIRFDAKRWANGGGTYVVMGVGAKLHPVTRPRMAEVLDFAQQQCKALRKTHSHQRQEINQFVENLRESDVFEPAEVEMTIDGFGDHASNIPRVDVRFIGVETVIASIRFLRYSPADLNGEIEVLFGDEVFEFDSVPKVLDFFGGWEVFRRTDRRVETHKVQLRAHGLGTIALVPYKELTLYAPYLLVMQANAFAVEQAKVTVTAETESPYEGANVTGINGALAEIFTQEQTLAYVSAVVEPSLQWDYSFK